MKIQPIGNAALACLAVLFLHHRDAMANPTGNEPNRPLAAHGTIPEAKGMIDSLYALYDAEEKIVIQYRDQTDNPASFSDRQLSKSYGRVWKALRDAQHLELMGEPAAEDLSKKFQGLHGNLTAFGIAYRGTPRGVQVVQRIQTNLQRSKPKLDRFLQQAEGALQQPGKLEVFEKQMEAKGIELFSQMVFFTPKAREPYISRFGSVLGKGDTLLQAKRREDYLARAKEAMTEQVAGATAFASEASRIRDEIAASGTATLGEGKTGDAAEAFAHVVNLWGTASAGVIRATAIQWAFTNRLQSQVQPDPNQLKETALASLASIVEAAAASTPPEKTQSVYTELLKQISIAERRCGIYSHDVHKACESALGKLAAKDPALPARVEAYRCATSEPLIWRKQFAGQQAKNLSQSFPPSASLLNSQSELVAKVRPNFIREPGRETTVAPAAFGDPANIMVQDAATRLVGKPVSDDAMIRLTPTSRSAVVPFGSRHYGNVPVALPSEAEVADLQTAIVVDKDHGPLTIDSADAVSAAEMQDYITVGGPIKTVHLEAAVTRFIGLPDIAYALVPLGRVPALDDTISPLQQTCWRLDLQPMWANQRYFTVRAKAATQ